MISSSGIPCLEKMDLSALMTAENVVENSLITSGYHKM